MDLQELLNAGVLQPLALTNHIVNEIPAVNTRLGDFNNGRGGKLFSSEGMFTTILGVTLDKETMTLVPTAPRGSPAQPKAVGTKREKFFKAVHLPQRSSVLADELLFIRAKAGNNFEKFAGGVAGKINALQVIQKRDLDYTLEFHRWGALKGLVLDADGSVILDVYDEFGVEQIEHQMALGTTTTKAQIKVLELKRKVEDVIGGVSYAGIHVYTSPGFFDKFVGHSSVERAYERYQEGRFNRDDNRTGFMFGNTNVTFEEVNANVKVGDSNLPYVPDGEAIAFPLGVDGMFIQDFAPADTIDAIGAETPMQGLPFYSKPYPLDHDKGLEVLSQSNPVTLNTRPRAIVRLTTN